MLMLQYSPYLYNTFNDLVSVQLHELNGSGAFMQEFSSLNNEYVARSYLIDDGGATVRAQVRVGITSKKMLRKSLMMKQFIGK